MKPASAISETRERVYSYLSLACALLFGVAVFWVMDAAAREILALWNIAGQRTDWAFIHVVSAFISMGFVASVVEQKTMPWKKKNCRYHAWLFFWAVTGWLAAFGIVAVLYRMGFPELGDVLALVVWAIPVSVSAIAVKKKK